MPPEATTSAEGARGPWAHLQWRQAGGVVQLLDGGGAPDGDHHGHQLLHLLPAPRHKRRRQAALHQPLEPVLQHLPATRSSTPETIP